MNQRVKITVNAPPQSWQEALHALPSVPSPTNASSPNRSSLSVDVSGSRHFTRHDVRLAAVDGTRLDGPRLITKPDKPP